MKKKKTEKKTKRASAMGRLTDKMVKDFQSFIDFGSPDYDGCEDEDHPNWAFGCDDSMMHMLYEVLDILKGILAEKKAQKKAARALKKQKKLDGVQKSSTI